MICAILQIAGQVKCRAFDRHDWRFVRVDAEGRKVLRCRRCGHEENLPPVRTRTGNNSPSPPVDSGSYAREVDE